MNLEVGNSNKGSFNIQSFLKLQNDLRETDSQKKLENIVTVLVDMLNKLCEVVSAATSTPVVTSDNIDSFLKSKASNTTEDLGRTSRKSKSMVEAQKEEVERKKALKKAKEEEEMLGSCMYHL